MEAKVMLIEDNEMNSRLAQKVLEAAGMEVTLFTHAEQALSKMESVQPEIILVDLQLPGISGYDFVRRVRAADEFSDIPLVAISANVRNEDKSRAFESGCDGFIEKPINTRKLATKLQEYLTNGRQTRYTHN